MAAAIPEAIPMAEPVSSYTPAHKDWLESSEGKSELKHVARKIIESEVRVIAQQAVSFQ
jgi:hypothetical protein